MRDGESRATTFGSGSGTALRLLVVCPSLATGGAERQLSILLPMLAERGFDVRVLVIREEGAYAADLRTAGTPVEFVPVRSRVDLRGVLRARVAAGSWPDLVLTQSLDAQLVGAVLARAARVPHVTIHHKQPELRMTRHRRLLVRLVSRSIERVIAVSSAQVADLLALGFAKEQIRIVANGIPDRPARPRGVVRHDLGLADSDFVALLVATLRPEKRAGVFADAVEAAQRRMPTVRGMIAGAGAEFDAMLARSGGRLLVLGERNDIPDLMAAADAVCLTSAAEALPMVILEAMASGRAVVSTAVGGIAEVVAEAQSGYLTPVDGGECLTERLCALASDPALAARMGRCGRERYLRFYSAETMADAYAGVLREVAFGPDGGRAT